MPAVLADHASFSDSETDTFPRLFQNIPLGLYRITPDGRILLANPALLEILGYDHLEEISGRYLETNKERLHQLTIHGQLRGWESFWLRRDGTRVYVRENANIVHGPTGEIRYYEGTVEAVVDSRSDEAQRVFFDSAPLVLGVIDLVESDLPEAADIRIIACSANIVALAGMTADQLEGRQVSELGIPPSLINRWRRRFLRAKEIGKPFRCEDGWGIGENICRFSVTIKFIGGQRYSYIVEDITERTRMQKELREREATLRGFYESVSLMMGIVELTTPSPGEEEDILHISDNAASAHGFGLAHPDEMQGRRSSELGVSWDNIRRWRNRYLESAETGKPVRFEYIHQVSEEGDPLWYAATVQQIQGKRFCYIVEDITEQRRNERDLRLLQAAVENANDVVMITEADPMGEPGPRVLYVNPALERMTGYSNQEILGKTPRILQGKETSDDARALLRRCLVAGKPIRTEILNYRKDGTPFYVDLNITPVTNASGQITHMVGIQRDITERHNAEKALQESEQRLQTILNNLPVVVFVLDQSGVFTFLEGKGLRQLGLESGQLIGQSFLEVYQEEPELIKNLQMVLSGSKSSWLYTKRNTTFEMQCRPLFTKDNKADGLIGVAVDVTERRQLREKILQSEKLAALGEFVAGIAHEINNPLAAISGSAQLLALYPDAQVQEDARSIRDMAERASHIVQSLIIFSRRSSVGVIQPDVYSLRTLLTEALALTESRLQNTGIQVDLPSRGNSSTDVDVMVRVDKGQLLQVLVNLLNNAEQALRECPSERRRIIARTGADNSVGWLSIADTGVGMPESVRQRIFEPFFTTKDFGEGSGLGLSLCHGIVEAHRGHIAVESQQGTGTTVTLYLPLFGIKEISENNKPL